MSVALRVRGGFPQEAWAGFEARRAIPYRAAHRLLYRRRYFRGAGEGDRSHMSTVTTEEAVVDGVNKKLFIGGSRFVIGLFIGLHVCFWR
jgi:hypothetical protein